MDKEKNKKSSTKQNTSKKKNNASKKDEKVTKNKVTKENEKEVSKKEMKKSEKVLTTDIDEEDIDEEVEEYNEDLDEEIEEDFEIDDEDLEEEYDEDLENFEDDEEEDIEEEEIIVTKVEKKSNPKKQEKKKNVVKEENTSKEKIEKIEKMAKEKKKKAKTNNNNKSNELFHLFEKYHTVIYSFIGGVFVATLVAFLIWPDRIATLKNGEQPIVKVGKETYTADELYENMKNYYSVSLLLDDIDNDLLTKLYPENDEMTEEVNSNAEYYINMYEQYYSMTEEEFLQQNGFSSYNAFLEYLKLDYRREKYLDEYVEKNLTDDEIQTYYDKNVFGDINTQHVLVEFSDDSEDEDSLTEDEAKALAEEIITKLNDGTSWKQIQEDYKDKITYEDLSYQSWDASLEESFMTAIQEMEENSYSEEPVQTSYGYHVIYKLDQKKKPTLKKSKDKIIENLVSDKKSEDSNLLYKALISLREEKKITFSDTVMKEKYETYCSQYK